MTHLITMASSRSYRKTITTDNETTKPLSLVQQRARQFEALATLQVKPKECNWWLSDFKNLKDITCECEPCENVKSIDESDVDSQRFVNVEEHVDDVLVDIVAEALDDEHNDELLSGEDISVGAKESMSEDEKISTNDNDDEIMLAESSMKGTVVEAMNNNVKFKIPSITHHGIKLTHTNDEETHATDE